MLIDGLLIYTKPFFLLTFKQISSAKYKSIYFGV